jgi:hypothetical protein
VDLALVVHPVHSEADHPIGLDQALEDLVLDVTGMPYEDRLEATGHLTDGLMEIELTGVLFDDLCDDLVELVSCPE